ncbi:MAG: DUF5688 family protein [Roseburia sp.]|nr:DUF5688 family protein [Roseburia sp.]
MNINEYYEAIRASIGKRMPGIFVRKEAGDGENQTRISVRMEGEKASPILCLDDYYEQYKKGNTLEETIQEILCDWREALSGIPDISEEDINDWEKARHRIFLALVSENMILPENTPSRKYLDMKLIVRYCVVKTDAGIQSFPVPQQLAEGQWHVSEHELYRTATENMGVLFPTILLDFYEFLFDAEGERGKGTENKLAQSGRFAESIYILTNRPGINGAAAICQEGLLAEIYHRFGSPYYVIPSSVHEMLIYPESERLRMKKQYRPENMRKIIREVNCSSLRRKERLSDSLYYYNGTELVIAGEGGNDDE